VTSRPVRIDRAFAQHVASHEITYLRARSQFRLPGWGRIWPPRLVLSVAWIALSGHRVYLTRLQEARIRAMALALGWEKSPFVIPDAEAA
jgi:hypothetical protein